MLWMIGGKNARAGIWPSGRSNGGLAGRGFSSLTAYYAKSCRAKVKAWDNAPKPVFFSSMFNGRIRFTHDPERHR